MHPSLFTTECTSRQDFNTGGTTNFLSLDFINLTLDFMLHDGIVKSYFIIFYFMKKIFTILPLFFLFSMVLTAQTESEHHDTEKKEKGIYEIITSGIYAYSFEHEEGVVGTEVHLTYWFNHTWGSGLSYTAKFEEGETLHDIALLGSMNPTRWITLNIGPNFALSSDHREFELGFYAESEFNIRPTDWFHFGPVIGTVVSENTEGTIGFHLGFEF